VKCPCASFQIASVTHNTYTISIREKVSCSNTTVRIVGMRFKIKIREFHSSIFIRGITKSINPKLM
jgi:hypothetical protein